MCVVGAPIGGMAGGYTRVAGRRASEVCGERTLEMVAEIRVLNRIVAGHGSRSAEYRAGDVVLAALPEAMEWCLRGWATPATTPSPARNRSPRSATTRSFAPPVPQPVGTVTYPA
jgi:hypothetical protein